MSCFSAFSPQKGALTEVPTPLVEVAKRFSAFSPQKGALTSITVTPIPLNSASFQCLFPSERGSDPVHLLLPSLSQGVSVPFPLRKGL